MQITTTIDLSCAECGGTLATKPSYDVRICEVEPCRSCTEHGSARTMDTIETSEDGRVYFNGRDYGRLQFADLIQRMIAGLGIDKAEHGRELMAKDSDRDERGLEN